MDPIISDHERRILKLEYRVKYNAITIWFIIVALFILMVATAAHAQSAVGSTTTIFPRSVSAGGYDYVPNVINDTASKMYWCGSRYSVPADHIFFANARLPTGTFHSKTSNNAGTFNVVLSPTGKTTFDRVHVCDPSVVRFTDGKWYLYYSGLNAANSGTTSIGVASSYDGITFTRLNGGRAVLLSNPSRHSVNHYGTGQPSAFIKDGFIYISYTDSYGAGTNPGNGAGQFLLRSTDPTLQQNASSWNGNVWVPLQNLFGHTEQLDRYLVRTAHSYYEAFSVDIAYIPAAHRFLVAAHKTNDHVDLMTFDSETLAPGNLSLIPYTKSWVDGPALYRFPDGTLDCANQYVYGSFGSDVYHSLLGVQKYSWTALCQ
jgi:hypothetical protein